MQKPILSTALSSVKESTLAQFTRLHPAIVVFVVALILRVLYLVVFLDNQILQFGDAFYYLTTGSLLAKAIVSSSSPMDLISSITPHGVISVESGQSFVSTSLPARLLMDGPIYSSYLAFVAILLGFAGTTEGFNQFALQVSLVNAVVDSLSCVLVYLLTRAALGGMAAAIASILFIIYPPAVLNTARCYSEPFAYFILLVFANALIAIQGAFLKLPFRIVGALVCGLAGGAVILVRPVFLPIAALALIWALLSDWLNLRTNTVGWAKKLIAQPRLSILIAFAVGLSAVVFPWYSFSQSATGQGKLMVSRAPAYNLFVGNQLRVDGWKTWPVSPGFRGDLSKTVNQIAQSFAEHPIDLVALEFKKVARLWCGGWNDFQYSFFGAPHQIQNVYHQLLLFFGFVGACILYQESIKNRNRKQMLTLLVLVTVPAVHFVYALFEPTSRYSLTAMPFVSALAAVAVASCLSAGMKLRCVVLAAYCALFFAWLSVGSLIPFLISDFSHSLIVSGLIETVVRLCGWAAAAYFVFAILIRSDFPVRQAIRFVSAGLLVAVPVSLCSQLFDPAFREWSIELKSREQTVIQKVKLPDEKLMASKYADFDLVRAYQGSSFLLIDMRTENPAPSVRLHINGVPWESVALPWYTLREPDTDIATIMHMQGGAMSRDWRSFRQWWAVPFPSFLLEFGKENEFAVVFNPQDTHSSIKLYGDYWLPGEKKSYPQPALESFSWTKGFATYDTRDSRVFEAPVVDGEPVKAGLWFGRSENAGDLSLDRGKQIGLYRVHVAFPVGAKVPAEVKADAPEAEADDGRKNDAPQFEVEQKEADRAPQAAPDTMFKIPENVDVSGYLPKLAYARVEETTINGADPKTYSLFKEPQKLPKTADSGGILEISFDHSSSGSRSVGPVAIAIKGVGKDGKATELVSPWMPTALPVEVGWHHFSFSESLPEGMTDLTVQVVLYPFQLDRLFLHRKEALKEVVAVKDIKVLLYPPLNLPGKDVRRWIYF